MSSGQTTGESFLNTTRASAVFGTIPKVPMVELSIGTTKSAAFSVVGRQTWRVRRAVSAEIELYHTCETKNDQIAVSLRC